MSGGSQLLEPIRSSADPGKRDFRTREPFHKIERPFSAISASGEHRIGANVRPGRTHVAVRIKGKREASGALVVTHVGPPHREPRPIQKPAQRKRKKVTVTERWVRQAMRLIKTGASQWTHQELDQCASLQSASRGWLEDKRRQDARKYRTLFRELEKVQELAKQRFELELRGTGGQNDHPERNAINNFSSASGRVRWGTKKRFFSRFRGS